jgi:hypothetical protein
LLGSDGSSHPVNNAPKITSVSRLDRFIFAAAGGRREQPITEIRRIALRKARRFCKVKASIKLSPESSWRWDLCFTVRKPLPNGAARVKAFGLPAVVQVQCQDGALRRPCRAERRSV